MADNIEVVRYKNKLYTIVAEAWQEGEDYMAVYLRPVDILDITSASSMGEVGFVKAWLHSNSISQVAELTGKTSHQVSSYAHWLKTKGVVLPNLKSNAPKGGV